MNSFRVVDTRFRILKGGKIGLAASIALIGGMLTLGSTSANAVSYFDGNVTYNDNNWLLQTGHGSGDEYIYVDGAVNVDGTSDPDGNRTTDVRTSTTIENVYFNPEAVESSYTAPSWVSGTDSTFNTPSTIYTVPTDYTITFNSGANALNISKDVMNVYAVNYTSATYTPPSNSTQFLNISTYTTPYTANLIFQGTNVVSGNTDIDAGNIRLNGGVTFAGTVQAGSADVYTSSQITFNDHVDLTPGTTDTLKFYNGGNVVLNNGLDGNIDFNGQNAIVTLSNGDIEGNIDTSTNGSGTLKFTTSTASSVLGNIGTTANLKEIIMDGTGSVDVDGSVDTNLVTFNSAGTLQVNSLDTTRQDSTLGTVNFKEFNGTLKVDGGNLTGNIVTDLGNNGIVTMMNGSQSITGQIGTDTNKIKTLNIGDTGEDSYSVTTMNGDIYAQNIVFNNLSTTNGSELRIAADYDVTAAITTADDGMGTLKLLGGTQTVTGQVGTTGMRLAEIRSGEANATSTFKNSVYSDDVYVATGSTTFDSTLTVTDLLSSSGTLLAKGATVVDGTAGQIDINAGTATFESTVTLSGASSKVNVDGGTATFKDIVALNASLAQIAVNSGTVTFEKAVTTNSSNSLITIDGGTTTFDGTVTVGDSISTTGTDRDTLVTFNDDVTTNNGNISFTDSTVNMGTGEDSIIVSVGRDLLVNDSVLTAYANTSVANDVTVSNTANVDITGNLTLSGEDSTLTINDSTFEITGSTLLNDEYKYSTIPSETSISIANSDATFNGTVIVSSASGDLNISNGSDVTFNDTVTIGGSIATTGTLRDTLVTFNDNVTTTNGSISFTDSTVNMGTVEDPIIVSVGDNLLVNDASLTAYSNILVDNDVIVSNTANVDMVGNLTLTGADSTLIINDSTFEITGDVALNHITATSTSIEINGSTARFNGTVKVSDNDGDLQIANGSNVVFNGQENENSPAVFVGDNMNITNSTVAFGTINGEDNTISAFTNVEVGNTLTINSSTVRFGSTVETNDLSIYNDSEVTFDDTVAIGDNLTIADSAVTFEKAVTIENISTIYSYAGSTTNVHFEDTVIANADIFVDAGSSYNYDTYTYDYGNTTVTFDKDLTIAINGDSFGTLHLDGDYVTVNANGHINANVEFDDNAELNVADTKNIYGTVRTTSDGSGILNFLGSTTLNSDIGEDSLMLSQVNFGTSGEDTVFTQDIGYDVYAYQTTIGNGDNLVTANIKDDVRFGEDLRVRSGSTLNIADNDVTVDHRLILESGSTTSFKVYTTDISAGQAVENANSGSITTNYLTLADDAKFNINYDGSWYGAGTYNLISAEYGFNSGEDYVGTEANGLVTDNSIIDSVIKRSVDTEGNEFLTLYADRTGGGSYDAEDLYIKKSDIGTNYSNGASQSLAGYADGTQREGALADIINEMEDLDGGVVITDDKKQQLADMQQLLAPVANNSAIQSSLTATNLAVGTIGGRISEVRGAGGSVLALNDTAKTGLSAGESTLDTALWIKAVGSTATQDKVGQFDGYDADTYGIVAGADKTLKNGTILGLALAYSDTETEQSDFRAGDSSDTNSIQATAYASKDFGNLYVDGMLSYTKHSTDAIRTANSGKLSSDIDANQYSAKVETGYKFALAGTTTLTPFASVEYGTLDQKSYTEKGTSYQNDALKVDGVKVNVGTVGLGAKLATNVKAGNMTLIPELTLAAYNSFGDDSADIKAQYVGGGNKFITPTQELNETMFNIGAGVKTALSESSTLIFDLDHDRSENGNFEGYSGSVSYRLSF